jgi:hypothetical protein
MPSDLDGILLRILNMGEGLCIVTHNPGIDANLVGVPSFNVLVTIHSDLLDVSVANDALDAGEDDSQRC